MRTIKFLGIEWNKADLKALAFVIGEGLRAELQLGNPKHEEKIKKAMENIEEIIE